MNTTVLRWIAIIGVIERVIKISLINYFSDFMFNNRKFSTSCSHMLVKTLCFNSPCSNKVFVTYVILFKNECSYFCLKSNSSFAVTYCITCLSFVTGILHEIRRLYLEWKTINSPLQIRSFALESRCSIFKWTMTMY